MSIHIAQAAFAGYESRQVEHVRTEIRRKRAPFTASRYRRIDAAIQTLRAAFPGMVIEVQGSGAKGAVHLTGSNVTDLKNQAPDIRELHYLLIKATAGAHSQSDFISIEFGNQEGPSRFHAFRRWFRRVQAWDVRITAQSPSAQHADRMLATALSALRGERITTLHVGAFSLLPAILEILGATLFVGLVATKEDLSGSGYALALVSMFYWRLAFFIAPDRAHIYLKDRRQLRGILSWSPSPRAQAVWTVVGGLAGLAALIIAILAWLVPQSNA
ncbi:hypothetical protein [Streptomyces massasporeus]|uniref:hypothetical protein n=1 Tax=Streptomyces massasporeus TaxID=67324 RepID=UPI0036625BC6